MVPGLLSDLVVKTNCNLTSNAKVQWMWTNVADAALAVTTNRYSFVVTSATEEFVLGATAVAGDGSDPYIIVAGGATYDTW